LNNLRYIKIQNDGDPATDATSTLVCEIDNIEFFNGKKILLDDFSSYANQADFDAIWITDDVTRNRGNPTTDVIDFSVGQQLWNNHIYRDLGLLDSNEWRVRFKYTLTTFTPNTFGSGKWFFITLTSSTDPPNSTTHDAIGFYLVTYSLETKYTSLWHNQQALSDATTYPNDTDFTHSPTAETLYVEIRRISEGSATIKFFSDSTYTTLIESQTQVIPIGAVKDLRYFHIGGASGAPSVTGSIVGTIDNLEVYNGRPIPSSIDTIQEDFSSGINWTTSNAPNINVDSGVINFNLTQNASNATIARDLSSGFVDATKWLLRFKINFSSITDQAQAIIGLSSTDQTVNFGTGAQDSLQVEFSALTGANTIHLFYNAGVGRISAGSISLDYTTGTDYYVELIRTENTKATLHIYSNSNFTELIGSLNNITIGSGVSLLRYIKIGNVSSSIDTGNHTGTIDNIEFFNGVSVANTVKRSIPDLEFDFSDSIGWVQTSTGVVVDTVDQRIEGWANDGSDRRVTFDMGSSGILSEQNWTIEFEYEFSASSLPAHGIFTISDVNLDVWFSPAPTVDAIGIFHGTSIDQLVISYKDGSGGNILSTDVIPISFNTRYYVRLERIKNTILKLSVFSDPDFTKHVTSSPIFLTTLSTIANLRYLRSGNASQGSVLRTLTGFLRNLKVYRTVRGTDKDNKYLVIG